MKIAGITKTSLVDYNEHLASTVFTCGCNMKCPFCHNKDLILTPPTDTTCISPRDIISFLKSRANVLEGVCITGGEPSEQLNLTTFIDAIKEIGLKVKLDTNGLNYTILENIIQNNLVDYIAMDIKNSEDKYAQTAGIHDIDIRQIKSTVSLLMNSTIDYEFRTTAIKEFHTTDDFLHIGKWLSGATQYYIQKYEYSENQLASKKYTAFEKDEILTIINLLHPYFKNIDARGY